MMTMTSEKAELCFPQLNSSCRKIMRPHSVSMLIYFTLSFISVLTVVLNLLVIISISHFKYFTFINLSEENHHVSVLWTCCCLLDCLSFHTGISVLLSSFSRKLHTPTNLLLLSLAVSDFFVGLLMVFQIILIDGCWFLGDLMCALYFVLDYAVTSASIGTMVLISIDRYLAVCYPLLYPTRVTQNRVKVCVSVCWVACFLCHCLILKDNVGQPGRYNSCYGECVVIVSYAAGIADVFISFIGPVTVIVILYVRIFVVAVSQARAMRSHIKDVTLQGSIRVTVKNSELKAARTLGVVVVIFLMCVCPYFCVTLKGDDAVVSASSAAFVMCLFYLNSCLNPLIYAFLYSWFRNCIRVIVTLQILKPGSCEANVLLEKRDVDKKPRNVK